MNRYAKIPVVAAVVSLSLALDSSPAEARKEYFDAFVAKYPAVAAQAAAQKCAVCHGKTKVMRSVYAQALATALGAKNVKKVEDINQALDTVATQDSGNGNGTTYGDLLQAGTLPAPFAPPPPPAP